MAGTHLTFELDDREVQRALQELLQRTGSLAPVLRDIGEHLVNTTRERFEAQKAPSGQPWAPLSSVTQQRKSRNANKVLIQDGDLMRDLVPSVNGNTLEVTNNRIYAAMQQFGGTKAQWPHLWGDIPARPFMGFSDDDRQSILDIAREHLSDAF